MNPMKFIKKINSKKLYKVAECWSRPHVKGRVPWMTPYRCFLFFSVTSRFLCTPLSYKATWTKREKTIKIFHILARFASNLPSAIQMSFFPEKKSKITTNTVHQNSFTATFVWKQCQRVQSSAENAAVNIRRMYSVCSVAELFLARYSYF